MTNKSPGPQSELDISIPKLDIPTILEKIILGGIIFILALPLLGDYGMWLFPIGRDIIFKLAVEFLFVIYLIFLLVKKQLTTYNLQLTTSPIALSLISFWVIMALATIFSVQQEFSIWGNIYKNQGLMTWTHYVLFFFLLIGFLKEKRYWDLFVHTAIIVGGIIGLITLWQALQNGFDSRPASTLNNPDYLAAYLVLLLPITLAFFLKNKSYILGSALAIQFLALIFTQTRGGYLGIAVAVFIFISLYLAHNKKGSKRKIFLRLATFLIILLTTYYLLLTTGVGQSFQQKLPGFTDKFLDRQTIVRNIGPRLEAWQTGWQGMLKRPLLGYGPENFFVAFDEHYSGSQDRGGSLAEEGSLWESWFDKAHNFIFDIGATTGFLGLFAYILIFGSALYMLSRKLSLIKIGLIASLLGYTAQNLLGFDTLVPGMYLVFFLAFVNFITQKSAQDSPIHPNSNAGFPTSNQIPKSKGQNKKEVKYWGIGYPLVIGVWILGFLALSTLFIFSFKVHLNILRANHQLNLAESLARNVGAEQAFSAFAKGLEYNAPPINPNLRRRYAVIALAYHNIVENYCSPNSSGSDPDEPPLLRGDPDKLNCENLFNGSKNYLARALELQQENAAAQWPRFTRNYIYAAQISHILGDYEASDLYFESALELSPNRTSINTEWARLKNLRKK